MDIQTYEDFIKYQYVSRETFEKFLIYSGLLKEWQKKMNLVGSSTIKNCLNRHFLDSAQLHRFLNNSKGEILDFGSGAGFPGLVLSIMGIKNINLIEAKKKKCDFMKKVILETGVNSKVYNTRIESLPFLNPDYIISRALTSTKNLIEICYKYCNNKNKLMTKNNIDENLPNLLFLKGKNVRIELDDLAKRYKINFKLIESITDRDSKTLYFKSKS